MTEKPAPNPHPPAPSPAPACRVAVLMTCHNRRAQTLAALGALYAQRPAGSAALDVYLVDDGSTDGTSDAVIAAYPQTRLIRGTGNLYWGGGMRLAYEHASRTGYGDDLDDRGERYSYYLWLNDDTTLDPGAVHAMLETHRALCAQGKRRSVVVGSTRDPDTGNTTYGGMVKVRSAWNPLKFQLLEPGAQPLRCDTLNGNCVLIPRGVVEEVGHIDPHFTHGIGDSDFGLRAVRKGCGLWLTPGHVGTCRRNDAQGGWLDPNVALTKRLKMLNHLKAFPLRERAFYARRHAGLKWFMHCACAYASVVRSWARHRWAPKRSDRAESVGLS